MKIGVATPRQSDLDQVPAAVIVVSGMEWLVDDLLPKVLDRWGREFTLC